MSQVCECTQRHKRVILRLHRFRYSSQSPGSGYERQLGSGSLSSITLRTKVKKRLEILPVLHKFRNGSFVLRW